MKKSISSVLFICTGNICRSPMAEALLNHLVEQGNYQSITVASRGTAAGFGQPMHPEAVQALQEMGLTVPLHKSWLVEPEDVQKADLILAMQKGHLAILHQVFPKAKKKTHLLKMFVGFGNEDIGDPMGLPEDGFQRCRDELKRCLTALLEKIGVKKEGSH